MKQKLIAVVVLALITIIPLAQAAERHISCGDTNIPVIFQDQTISDELKDVIIKDINLIHAHFEGFKIYHDPRAERFLIDQTEMISTNHLQFLEGADYWPEGFNENFGSLLNIEGQNYICITDNLIRSYEKAHRFAKKHKKEMRKLREFVTFMNSLSNQQFSRKQILGLVYFHKSARPYRKAMISKYSDNSRFSEDGAGYKFRSPSILEIGKGFGTDLSHKLTAPIYRSDENGIMDNNIIIIYDKGKWKILSYFPGT